MNDLATRAYTDIFANPVPFVEMIAAFLLALIGFYVLKTFVFPVVKAVVIVGVIALGYLCYTQGFDKTVQQVTPFAEQAHEQIQKQMPKADPFLKFKE